MAKTFNRKLQVKCYTFVQKIANLGLIYLTVH
jgi:hypothetical protein